MKILFQHPLLVLAAVGSLFLSCSTVPVVQDFPATASPSEEIVKLGEALKGAKESQVDVLAPASFKKAVNQLASAESQNKKKDSAKETLHEVALGQAYLARALKDSDYSRNNMPGVVDARAAALVAGAGNSQKKDLEKADAQLIDITANVEKGDVADVAKDRNELQVKYLEIELQAIKNEYLEPVRNQIRAAEKEGAKEYAPQTLAQAKQLVDETEAFIVANRKNLTEIRARSDAAMTKAQHLASVTKKSISNKDRSPEETTLILEQSESQTEEQAAKLDAEKDKTQKLSAMTANLKSDKDFNQQYEKARKQFSKDEAEVYRQGDNLVIRLRSLKFPTNQAVLTGKNMELLSKVSKVVSEFENSAITVEGHTDSQGRADANKKLSVERAETISKYLASSAELADRNISAVGHGSEVPLAPNKTAEGRAQNRRVDLIISPDQTVR